MTHKERRNEWMFQTVECSAYLKKVMDGRHIYKIDKRYSGTGRDEWFYADEHNKDEKARARIIPDEDVEGSDFIKTYYELKEKLFTGVVVGFELATVKAELFLDSYDDGYNEGYFVNKRPAEQVKCARVFFGCNRSRLVPMDKMVVLKEGDRSKKKAKG